MLKVIVKLWPHFSHFFMQIQQQRIVQIQFINKHNFVSTLHRLKQTAQPTILLILTVSSQTVPSQSVPSQAVTPQSVTSSSSPSMTPDVEPINPVDPAKHKRI